MQKIMRRPEVRAVTGLSNSSIDRLESAGDFPRRVQLSSNAIGWILSEITEWLDTRKRGGVKAPTAANAARRKSGSESRSDTAA